MSAPASHPPLGSHRVVARNLAEHARNPIHTDAGAQAAGFPRALVAGVTTYAYVANIPARDWGTEWLDHGGAEVRFRKPVFDGDTLTITSVDDDSGTQQLHVTARSNEQPRVICSVTPHAGDVPPLRPGEDLPSATRALTGEFGADYAARAGDPLELFTTAVRVHPAVWPALANDMVHSHVARGSWIHTRSIIRHHHPAQPGDEATVIARVVDRRDGALGERALLDVHIAVDDIVVASLEHEAYVALR